MKCHRLELSSLPMTGRFAGLIALLVWALAACATAPPKAITASRTPLVLSTSTAPLATATERAVPTAPTPFSPTPPPTPLVLSADGCPAPGETYRNEVMGIVIPVPQGRRVAEPQYLSDDYGVSLVEPGESPSFQVIWLTQQTPEQLEAVVAEQLTQLADLPTTRAPVVVAGIEGVMLSPVPGVVAHTAVYLPVDDRLFLLLYPNDTLDDAGRCLLAGLSFFPPTRTLAELGLPTDSGVPAVATPTPTTTPAPVATVNLTPVGSCPPLPETYRSEAMGISLPVPVGYRVFKPAFSGDDYTLVLVSEAERDAVFQATWFHQATAGQLEAVVEEQIHRWHDAPMQRIPITVPGIEGLMLTSATDEVSLDPIFLVVDDRVYRLVYEKAALDDLGRCLLAGISFFTPTLTLEEQFLTQEADARAATRAASIPTLEDTYGFSFGYPSERWTRIDRANDPHALTLVYHEMGVALRIRVARATEQADSQLYGGAAGEFAPLGEVMFMGEPISRSALVYEGVTRAVYYNDTAPIARGDLLFTIALVSNRNYTQGAVVPADVQAEADRILETFVLAQGE